ncbi:MAG: DUF1049 domain-containing protein [Synechococcales cyanobacterium C42_A2020_086]|jgi:uncharacterized integral membrane protein|nr:DUF1049 domain-containing protein [Synechococcales cyanobacterium M58_A2018_015]MBF2073122.1 DUF1049 domain-containing protein [Synechococcales cyanobacterium C42_A2020_086]
MARILIPLLASLWVSAIALVAIQNAAPVSLRFLGLQTVEVPIGLLLAFSVSLGMAMAALLLPLVSTRRR